MTAERRHLAAETAEKMSSTSNIQNMNCKKQAMPAFAPAQPGRAAPRTRTLQGPYEGPQRSARPKTITL